MIHYKPNQKFYGISIENNGYFTLINVSIK